MLPQSAYIKLVEESTQQSITLNDVKQLFERYIEQTGYTGKQLNWDYAKAAFPYTIEHTSEGEGKWFYLRSTDLDKYSGIAVGVGMENVETDDDQDAPPERHYIQIVLPANAQHGDKAKANEFCKYLAKHLQAELHLFNGRIMYFYPQK